MIGLPSETRVPSKPRRISVAPLANHLALLVQEVLRRDKHCGHLFVFRGKRGGY